jgi:glutaminyl-tRNA synthetase
MSEYRGRGIEDNMEGWRRMKRGEYKEGEAVLRLKIDMSHPNPTMRDPVIYRIKNILHPTT